MIPIKADCAEYRLAMRLVPEAKATIDSSTFYDDCIKRIAKEPALRAKCLSVRNRWPQDWLYWWALYAGDRDVVLPMITGGLLLKAAWFYMRADMVRLGCKRPEYDLVP